MKQKRTVSSAIKTLNNQFKRYLYAYRDCTPNPQLTSAQFGVILFVGDRVEKEDVFQKDIEIEFHIRRSTATGILQLMEKNGLIQRQVSSHDARMKKLILTEQSKLLYQQAKEKFARIEEKITKGILESDLENFYRTIDQMIENLQ